MESKARRFWYIFLPVVLLGVLVVLIIPWNGKAKVFIAQKDALDTIKPSTYNVRSCFS